MNSLESLYLLISINAIFLLWLNWRIYVISKNILQVSIDLLKETVIIRNETISIRKMTGTITDETILLRKVTAGELDEIQVATKRKETSCKRQIQI